MKVLKVPEIYKTMNFQKMGFGPILGFKTPMAKVYSSYGRSTGPEIEKQMN